ncbi:MAG: hypothetical protein JXO22_12570 [Phycisphaerae bacterium]|nr:hypothetical protein [Phycisphaerae bacterium]
MCSAINARMRHWMAATTLLALLSMLVTPGTAWADDQPVPAGGNDNPVEMTEIEPGRPVVTEPTAEPADSGPAAPTAEPGREPVMALVIEANGDVQYAGIDSDDWKPVTEGLELPEATQVRTGIRSSVKFQIGEEEPYTAMIIESVGKVVLSEAYKTEDTKRVRVGVGYGKIRAGVAEGGLKSDFTVDSPVLTLSKRGTWNFGLAYTRGTDEFEVFLLDRGLIEALNKITMQRRQVLPREAVTQAMRKWLDQAAIARNVAIADILGQSDIDVAFNRLRNDGLGVMGPGQGSQVLINLSQPSARQSFSNLAQQALPIGTGGQTTPTGTTFRRPEGYFGTGRGDQLINVVIDKSSDLARQGFAKPGNYQFRRSTLEGWLQNNR